MNIEQEKKEQWWSIKEYGDTKRIAESIGVSVQTIDQAYSKLKCSPRVYKAISEFYKQREKELQKLK